MRSPFLSLLDAQRRRIENETGFTVYDDFPSSDVAMPYVVVGDVVARDWSDKLMPGQTVNSTIHVWSNYPGRKEAAEMIDKILYALSKDPLYLNEGFRVVLSTLEMSEIMIDIDGKTRHGIIEIKYLIEEV